MNKKRPPDPHDIIATPWSRDSGQPGSRRGCRGKRIGWCSWGRCPREGSLGRPGRIKKEEEEEEKEEEEEEEEEDMSARESLGQGPRFVPAPRALWRSLGPSLLLSFPMFHRVRETPGNLLPLPLLPLPSSLSPGPSL